MDESTAPADFSYDRVAYPSVLLPDQSPDRLCVSAYLHGLKGADPATASGFEIGCGTGLNLLAHAAAMPQSRAVGFDLSRAAIDRGAALAAAAGIDNADLHVGDIMTYPRDGRQFDYVVCHGVFSWVPLPVRELLLELIAARLAPGGIAYLSLECLPGAAAKAAIARLLRRNRREGGTVAETMENAARIIAALSRSQRQNSPLRTQLDILAETRPWRNAGYFYHDWLAEHYAPIDLEEFIGTAAGHGLAVAGSASNDDIEDLDLDDEGLELLASFGGDPGPRLAGLDMVQGPHPFHRLLLVRADAPPPAIADGHRHLRYAFEGWRRAVDAEEGPAVSYGVSEQSFVTANHPDSIAVLDSLIAARPNELGLAEIAARTGLDPSIIDQVLAGVSTGNVVIVHASPQPYVAQPGERPRVTGLSRTMLESDNHAISLRGVFVEAEQPETSVCLQLCDGGRTRAEIAAEMGRRFGREFPVALIDSAIATFAALRVFEA